MTSQCFLFTKARKPSSYGRGVVLIIEIATAVSDFKPIQKRFEENCVLSVVDVIWFFSVFYAFFSVQRHPFDYRHHFVINALDQRNRQQSEFRQMGFRISAVHVNRVTITCMKCHCLHAKSTMH